MHFFLWLDEVRKLVLVVQGEIERDLRAKVEMPKSLYSDSQIYARKEEGSK